MRAFSKRLVARVVLIVFMVIVPALAIIVYDQFNERHRSREEAIENTSRLARLAASEQSRVLEGVQRLLSTLALFPSLRDGDAAGCRTVLPDVLRSHPSYINIFVANSEGSMLCMAADVPAARDAGYNPANMLTNTENPSAAATSHTGTTQKFSGLMSCR